MKCEKEASPFIIPEVLSGKHYSVNDKGDAVDESHVEYEEASQLINSKVGSRDPPTLTDTEDTTDDETDDEGATADLDANLETPLYVNQHNEEVGNRDPPLLTDTDDTTDDEEATEDFGANQDTPSTLRPCASVTT